jgi:ABC-type transporter Mla subunit MlaD
MQDNFKTMLAAQQAEEQSSSNDLTDAENVLRKAQEALANVQGQLNDVLKKLQPASGK